MKPYPGWFKRLLMLVASALWLTGLLLTPTLLMMRTDMDVAWQLASGQRIGVAATHAGAAMLALMMVGSLWTVHMRAGWRKRRQRASGAILCVGTAALALTALVLYYSGDESVAAIAAWIHVGVGVALLLPFGWHAWFAPARRHHAAHLPQRPRSRAPRRASEGRRGRVGHAHGVNNSES